MLPNCLITFIDAMHDREAAKKLHKKLNSMQQDYDDNISYLTKIAYYVDSETKVARLIFTDRIGKESFDIFTADIEKFVSESHTDETGKGILVFGIPLKDNFDNKEIELLENYNDYCQKKISKDEAKKLVQVRFKVGDVIALRSKIRDGSKKNFRKFIVKKIIWSIHSNPVNIIIAKQISGNITNMSLTKADCKKYHIKYEENLQVYSMFMNFIKVAKNE